MCIKPRDIYLSQSQLSLRSPYVLYNVAINQGQRPKTKLSLPWGGEKGQNLLLETEYETQAILSIKSEKKGRLAVSL